MISDALRLPCGVMLKNRIVKSAMSEALGNERNNTTPGHIALFQRRGMGGAALLITGNTPVDRWHLEHAANVVLDAASDLNGMIRLAKAAKSGAAKVLVQLCHAGRQTPVALNRNPLSVSDLALSRPGYGKPKPATEEEMLSVVDKFALSASLAEQCGFDGVQVHAAHGYLLSSSLSPRINTRTDRWGGSLENRARLLVSVARAVRAKVGAGFIVAVKLNSSDFQKGGFDHQDSIEVAKMLQNEGMDFIEISGGNFETPVSYQYSSTKESTRVREAYFLDYAHAIKAALGIPIMVTGGFRSINVMNTALSKGATDLIGMGRPFIINPEFPTALLDGLLDMAPAIERTFPPADELPSGAVLNWFCDQLALHGEQGNADLSISVTEGHERYLARMRLATNRLLRARKVSQE